MECGMKKIIILIVALCLVASGIWFGLAYASKSTISTWFDAREADGWLVSHDAIEVKGFPLNLNARIPNLELADPETGWLWSGPEILIDQNLRSAGDIAVTWPSQHIFATPEARYEIASALLRSDLALEPTRNLALATATTQLRDLSIAEPRDNGWRASLNAASIEITRLDGQDQTYDLEASITELSIPDVIRERLDPASLMPEIFSQSTLKGRFGFDRPWDISALEQARPQVTTITISEATAIWGDMVLRASGDLQVDPQGIPEGELALRAENWRTMLEIALRAGAIGQDLYDLLDGGLGFFAQLSGRPENLDIILRFNGGGVFAGPIPIGPAPRLILR